MTDKQKYLLKQMYNTISDLAEECEQDDKFHEVMIENNNLFPMSLDDWSYEMCFIKIMILMFVIY